MYPNNDPYSNNNSAYNDPYRNQDPYSKGSHLNRRDNLLHHDPYRDIDPYAKQDPYKHHDPYRMNDPYSNRPSWDKREGIVEKGESWAFFWFWLKREIQLLFNAEAGAQDQDLVFPIEEDFMKLRIAAKFFTRNLIAFFLTIIGFFLSFAIIAQIEPQYGQLKFVIALLYFFLILYILFLPTYEVISSFEYTIYRNVKKFYERIGFLFNSYRNSIFYAMIFNVLVGGILVYKPDLLHFFIKNNNITLEFFKKENVKSAYNLLAGITIFTWFLWIIFYNLVMKVAIKNRKEHLKAKKRKESEFYKHTSKLDEDE